MTVHLGRRLATVTKAGNRIVELSTQDGQVYRGLMYVDATYEGDLMARAGVANTVGREGNAHTARASTASSCATSTSSRRRSTRT